MFPRLGRRAGALIVLASLVVALLSSPALGARRSAPQPRPSPVAAVLQVQVIPVERAAQMVRTLYPNAHIRVDSHANALVVVAPQTDIDAMRTIVQGIDVKNPTQPAIDIITLKTLKPGALAARLHPLFPNARINVASRSGLLVQIFVAAHILGSAQQLGCPL